MVEVESTGWEITGASGITGTLETPVVNVSAGASYIRLPIKSPLPEVSLYCKV